MERSLYDTCPINQPYHMTSTGSCVTMLERREGREDVVSCKQSTVLRKHKTSPSFYVRWETKHLSKLAINKGQIKELGGDDNHSKH